MSNIITINMLCLFMKLHSATTRCLSYLSFMVAEYFRVPSIFFGDYLCGSLVINLTKLNEKHKWEPFYLHWLERLAAELGHVHPRKTMGCNYLPMAFSEGSVNPLLILGLGWLITTHMKVWMTLRATALQLPPFPYDDIHRSSVNLISVCRWYSSSSPSYLAFKVSLLNHITFYLMCNSFRLCF